MGSEQHRFPPQERRKRWGGCWAGLPCFGAQKGRKRIVPATRILEGNASAAQPNGSLAAGLPNQATALVPSLLAPPSSPASFSNSALPSTAQSPSCFLSLSANSPGGPSNAMYATGPYAHETQLVSPPVFSTFTTEPSTAPFTPPPELAHLTTPSSPDVPFAQYLKGTNGRNYIAANDLHATYSLYPGSPASSLRSPISRTSGDCLSSSFPERDFPPQWDPSVSPQNDKFSRSSSGRLSGPDTPGTNMLSQDTNFFCPDTFARYYRDHDPPFPHGTGRLSVSKDSDVHDSSGNGHQNRLHSKSAKQDVEEIEAYRASFGFSADEIITTSQYVEISDVMDDSFSMAPFTSNRHHAEERIEPPFSSAAQKTKPMIRQKSVKSEANPIVDNRHSNMQVSCNTYEDHKSQKQPGNVSGSSTPGNDGLTDEEDIFAKMGSSKVSQKYPKGMSSSDAEIDYRRGRSGRRGKGNFAWDD